MTEDTTERSDDTVFILFVLTAVLWTVAVVTYEYALVGGLAMLILALQALAIASGWVEIHV